MSDQDFELTLERLAAEREAAEKRYFAIVAELRERMQRVAAIAAAAETAAAAIEDWPRRIAVAPIVTPAASAGSALERPQPWPNGSGWRGHVNRWIRWLMRDYLETIDRREARLEALAAGVEEAAGAAAEARAALAGDLGPRLISIVDYVEQVGDASARTHGLAEAVRESLEALRAAVDAMEPIAERARLLGDAKHAEVLRRATEGPMRRTEILFDEVERRQEALVAELARHCQALADRIEES